MSRDADFAQLEKFMQSWTDAYKDFDKFLEDFLVEMAFRALAKIKPKTPVDTGALREMWTIGKFSKVGSNFEIEILNGMDYASFIEFGSRTVSGYWRDGRFMMTLGIDEVQRQIPARFNREFEAYLKRKGAN